MPGGGPLTLSPPPFVSDGEVYLNDVLVPEGRYVSICVADTGSGIPEEIRDEVFAPFFTTKAPGEGTGLGLSMVYSCVRTHGGFVRLVSSVGVGTTFQILLPVMAASRVADELRWPGGACSDRWNTRPCPLLPARRGSRSFATHRKKWTW